MLAATGCSKNKTNRPGSASTDVTVSLVRSSYGSISATHSSIVSTENSPSLCAASSAMRDA